MSQSHIKEILEALRGKTIVDSIRLSYKSPVLDSDITRLNDFPSVSIEKGSECIDLLFQPDFLTYVQWPYFSAVEQTQKVTGKADSLEVYAHQLFEDQNQDFALRFNEKGITGGRLYPYDRKSEVFKPINAYEGAMLDLYAKKLGIDKK